MAEKIVLIGAGSSNFGLGTVGDLLKSKVFEGSEIVLHDINPGALTARVRCGGEAHPGEQPALYRLRQHRPQGGFTRRDLLRDLDRGGRAL